jgi:hypothetical protein
MISRTEEFRRKVAKSWQLAENATSHYDREHWLRMTDHCSKMFEAERSTERSRSTAKKVEMIFGTSTRGCESSAGSIAMTAPG